MTRTDAAASRDRYTIAPQLEIYDRVPVVLVPYLTMIARPDFRSEVLNTDRYGFRVSHGPAGPIDSRSWWDTQPRSGRWRGLPIDMATRSQAPQ